MARECPVRAVPDPVLPLRTLALSPHALVEVLAEQIASLSVPARVSRRSHLEFFLESVSSFWCFGGSGFSFPSGGSLLSIVARISSERILARLARPLKP